MAANLMNVFKNTDLKNVGKSMSDVVSLAFKPNKKTGAKIARAGGYTAKFIEGVLNKRRKENETI